MSVTDLQEQTLKQLDDIRSRLRLRLQNTGDTSETCQLVALEIALNNVQSCVNGISEDDVCTLGRIPDFDCWDVVDATMWHERALKVLHLPDYGARVFDDLNAMHIMLCSLDCEDYCEFAASLQEHLSRPAQADAWTLFYYLVDSVIAPRWEKIQLTETQHE